MRPVGAVTTTAAMAMMTTIGANANGAGTAMANMATTANTINIVTTTIDADNALFSEALRGGGGLFWALVG